MMHATMNNGLIITGGWYVPVHQAQPFLSLLAVVLSTHMQSALRVVSIFTPDTCNKIDIVIILNM